MSLKCVLCPNTSGLIASPDEPKLLLQWQISLAVEENEFFVCRLHFERSCFEVEKVLKLNSVPSTSLEVPDGIKRCECCFKTFDDHDVKIQVSQQLKDVITKLLDFQVKQIYVCSACKAYVKFCHCRLNSQALCVLNAKRNSKTLQTSETK